MRVQLFNPPTHHYQGLRYRMNPPLGLPILAAVLRAAGHTASVTDLEALGVTPVQLADRFEGQRAVWPDWVGFTSLTSSSRGVRESIHALRGVGFDRGIVVGGPAATLDPEPFLAAGADVVVTGECEGNVVGILQTASDGVYRGEPAPIDRIPAPAWEVHRPHPKMYEGNAPDVGRPEGIAMFSRGCPHNCVFCGNPVFGRSRKRFRPPEQIEAEMGALREMGMRGAFVYDDELVGTPHPEGWLGDLADRLEPIARDGLAWKCQGRCSARHATPKVLGLLKKAGCQVVMWGVESFSQAVLDANRKGTTVAGIWATLRAAKEAGLKNWVFTMVGMYGETTDDARQTAEGLRIAYREGLIDYRQTTVTTVLPGTELYQRAVSEGWYREPPESGPQMHQVYQPTPWMAAHEIEYWRRQFEAACPVGAGGRA